MPLFLYLGTLVLFCTVFVLHSLEPRVLAAGTDLPSASATPGLPYLPVGDSQLWSCRLLRFLGVLKVWEVLGVFGGFGGFWRFWGFLGLDGGGVVGIVLTLVEVLLVLSVVVVVVLVLVKNC